MRKALCVTASVAVLAWGCGGGEDGTDAGPDGTDAGGDAAVVDAGADVPALPCQATADTLAAQVTAAYDAWLQRCFWFGNIASLPKLRAKFLNARLEPGWIQAEAAVKAGRIVLDCEAFNAWIEALKTGDCNADWNLPTGLQGTVATDGTCRQDVECAEGLYCTVGSCPGKCRPRAQAESSCDQTTASSCVLGYSCVEGTCLPNDPILDRGDPCSVAEADRCAGGACDQGTCVAFSPKGEACPAPDSCVASRCDSGTRTCVSLTPAGGACDLSSECEDGLYCPQFPDAGQCSEMKPVGGPCRPDWAQVLGMARDCLSGVCQGTGQLGTCAAEGVPACP